MRCYACDRYLLGGTYAITSLPSPGYFVCKGERFEECNAAAHVKYYVKTKSKPT